MAFALALVVLTQYPPPPPPPPPAPAPAQVSPATEREVTIKALREEVVELKDEKSGIGYFFPVIFIGAGIGLAVGGLVLQTDLQWLKSTLLIGGTAIAALSTLWLILRIVKSVSLGGQIDDKEDQLRALENQRLQLTFGLLPGGAFGGLALRL